MHKVQMKLNFSYFNLNVVRGRIDYQAKLEK